MAAKLKVRRENPYLVPCPAGYLSGRSSAISRKISDFLSLPGISSFLAKDA
ncbi:hypothetical protein [Pseudomonas sp. PB120]|uniref:hypothetical protein n=1 Tax=Pseudomonas sp. PB120 TaxID=2494700 RepID=UPI0012FD77E7|nr:hypothetical protein [Pseudomonas sp. PB120]